MSGSEPSNENLHNFSSRKEACKGKILTTTLNFRSNKIILVNENVGSGQISCLFQEIKENFGAGQILNILLKVCASFWSQKGNS